MPFPRVWALCTEESGYAGEMCLLFVRLMEKSRLLLSEVGASSTGTGMTGQRKNASHPRVNGPLVNAGIAPA